MVFKKLPSCCRQRRPHAVIWPAMSKICFRGGECLVLEEGIARICSESHSARCTNRSKPLFLIAEG